MEEAIALLDKPANKRADARPEDGSKNSVENTIEDLGVIELRPYSEALLQAHGAFRNVKESS